MTVHEDQINVHPGRQRAALAAAALIAVPAFLLRFGGLESSYAVEALLFGLSIVGAAFLLSWAAEIGRASCRERVYSNV